MKKDNSKLTETEVKLKNTLINMNVHLQDKSYSKAPNIQRALAADINKMLNPTHKDRNNAENILKQIRKNSRNLHMIAQGSERDLYSVFHKSLILAINEYDASLQPGLPLPKARAQASSL